MRQSRLLNPPTQSPGFSKCSTRCAWCGVKINPESRVKVSAGAAPSELIEQGWRVFLVKVHNEAGVTRRCACSSPTPRRLHETSNGEPEPPSRRSTPRDVARPLDGREHVQRAAAERAALGAGRWSIAWSSSISRDRGQREAKLAFDVGQGTQDLGFRNEVNLLFDCEPSRRR